MCVCETKDIEPWYVQCNKVQYNPEEKLLEFSTVDVFIGLKVAVDH